MSEYIQNMAGFCRPYGLRAKALFFNGEDAYKRRLFPAHQTTVAHGYSLNPGNEDAVAQLKKMGVGALRWRFMLPRLQQKYGQIQGHLRTTSRKIVEAERITADEGF